MSNARTLADLVSTGGELADGQISVSEISDLTATAAELNTLDGITATVTELNTLDGATSSIQDQLDNISVTSGSLTKSFANGETASITLSSAISPAPVVSVTKEVAQTGVSSKGGWDVATDGSNYELHDTAYDTTLTPGQIGFQLGEASYDSVSLSISSEEAVPTGITFNTDGTKMYIVGSSGDEVNQYSLSTAFDLSTASFDSVTFSVSSEEAAAKDIVFNSDGTKMYIIGSSGDDVNQYTLSTAFDISTASFDSVTFSVTSQDGDPTGLRFNADGTKMFISGQITDSIYQYTLSTGFDISTASYDSVSLSIASQDGTPENLAFNTDGTKLYVLGAGNDSVFSYTLSTAFDLSTASYDSVSFSVASQETSPNGITFSNDGTKMYIVGSGTDTVYQYSTSKDALLLGSGSFASTDVGKRIVGNGGEAILTATDGSYSEVTAFDDSSTIASGSWSMFALTFDGTDGVTMNQLVSSTFDIENASYDGVSFSFSSQDTAPLALAFNNDGTKVYMSGASSGSVFQYSLSTAFDLSTASYDSVSFDVSSQDGSPQGLKFNNSGTKMYIVGGLNDSVYQYSLSTAYDLSTASYDSVSLSVNSEEAGPTGITFNNDGTKLYIIGSSGDEVNQYSLSTAFDLSTASYDSVSFSVASQELTASSITFNNDGTKMYICGLSSDEVFQYSLSTAFDLSTASYDSVSFSVTSQATSPQGLTFNNDGTKMYVVGSSSDAGHQYTTALLSTPTSQYHPTVTKAPGQIDTAFWTDINTMTADETLNGGEVYYAVSTDDRTTWAVIDDTDGVRNIVRDNAGTWQYNDASTYGGTTWVNATTNDELYALQEALEDGNALDVIGFGDASNWSYDSVSFDISSQETSPQGIEFNTDGTKMYVIGRDTDNVYQYSLSTAFDLSTASYDSVSFSVASQETLPQDLAFNNDGTKMYVVGSDGDDVNQYTLATAYDISTASFDSVTFSVSSQETTPTGLVFNNDGTKMYIVGSGGDEVNQYTLATAFDLSTASFDSVTFDVSGQETVPNALSFNNDGTKMYIVGQSGQDVSQYTLSTAFDVSTASFDNVTFSVASEEVTPYGMVFNNDGTKLYLVGNNDTVFQYSTSDTGNFNRMNSTQLDAVTDPNHYTLGNTLDLAIMLYTADAGSIPESDGVSINYDAEALNQGAVLGTDYDFDFPDSTTVRVTSNAAQNLKIRVV